MGVVTHAWTFPGPSRLDYVNRAVKHGEFQPAPRAIAGKLTARGVTLSQPLSLGGERPHCPAIRRRRMRSDAEIETYLNAVDKYATLKSEASELWRSAFLNLARARLSTDVSSRDHDPAMSAATVVRADGTVAMDDTATPFVGAWPPQALRTARREFMAALTCELQGRQVRDEIDKLLQQKS